MRKLEPGDTFQVIRFSQSASQLGPNPVPATRENVREAIAYVDLLQGSGGTMMVEGIKAALDFPLDPRRFRLVSFLTDVYIGNEGEILGEIHNRLGESRIFSFGVGSAVNRYLLDPWPSSAGVPSPISGSMTAAPRSSTDTMFASATLP